MRKSLKFNNIPFLILSAVILIVDFAYSSTDIDEKKQEMKRINEQIKEKIEEQYKLYEEEKNLLFQIQRYDKLLDEKRNSLKVYNNKLANLKTSISNLERDITSSTSNLKMIENDLKLRVIQIYKEGKFRNLRLLFLAVNFRDFLKRYELLKLIANKDVELREKVQKQRASIIVKKSDLEKKYKRYSELKNLVQNKEEEILSEKSKKESFLKNIKEQKELYEQTINELKEQSNKLGLIIKGLDKKIDVEIDSDIIKNKGKLPLPTKGKIVSYFGKSKHSKFNIYVFNNGIEISAEMGEVVISIFKGIVLFADWFKGYGKTILIDYGSGVIGVYGHLSEILVDVGQRVGINDVIGKVGDTGSFGYPSLYFEIRQGGKPVDPLEWVKESK